MLGRGHCQFVYSRQTRQWLSQQEMDRDRGTTVDRNLGSRHPTLAVCDANECRETEPHAVAAGYWMKVSCLECFVKSGSHRSHDATLEFGYVSRERPRCRPCPVECMAGEAAGRRPLAREMVGRGAGRVISSCSSHGKDGADARARYPRTNGRLTGRRGHGGARHGQRRTRAPRLVASPHLQSPGRPAVRTPVLADSREFVPTWRSPSSHSVPQKFAPVASSDHLTPSPPRRDAGMTPRPDHGRSQNHSQWLASAVSASCQIFRISGAFPAAELQSERPGDGLRRSPSLPDAGLRNRRCGRSVTKYTRPGGGASHPHFSRPPFLTDEGNEATAARFGDKRGLVRASRMAPCRRRTEAARKPCRRAILRCATALPPREHE